MVLYAIGTLFFAAGFVLGAVETSFRVLVEQVFSPAIVVVVLLLVGLQMTVLAMWLDKESNKGLSGRAPGGPRANKQGDSALKILCRTWRRRPCRLPSCR